MELQNAVHLQNVVDALNVEPATEDEALRFGERYTAAAGDLPRSETRPFTAAWLSRYLRSYVDPWLRSGHDAEGRELPSSRSLSDAGCWAVEHYLRRWPPQVRISPRDGLILYMGDTTGHPVGPGKLSEAVEAEARRLFTGLILDKHGHMIVEHDLDAIAEAFQEFGRKQSFAFCAEETH